MLQLLPKFWIHCNLNANRSNKTTTHSVERIDLESDNHLFDLVSPSDKEEARQDKCRFAEKQATARRRSNAATGFSLLRGDATRAREVFCQAIKG